MNKGFSGATIEVFGGHVVKRGKNVAHQSVLCMYSPLKHVCPKIINVAGVESINGQEFYCMERLDEPSGVDIKNAPEMLSMARDLLARHVWSAEYVYAGFWQEELIEKFHRVMGKDISTLTRMLWVDQGTWQHTHGDPTLSNMMYRDDHMVIIDPIRSNYVAPHWTADVGKMLQSAIGWERQLAGWYYSSRDCIDTVLRGMDERSRRLAWFWCMVHCMRIVPYARTAERDTLRRWAEDSALALRACLESGDTSTEGICTTLSI